jgi:hypothetical protein
MARFWSLDPISDNLKNELSEAMRSCDEAVCLPSAHRSEESATFKNVMMRLKGDEGGLDGDVFSHNWFSGLSVVELPTTSRVEALLRDSAARAEALRRLAIAIPSEMQSSDVQVGPPLDGDEDGRDIADWTPGLDGPSSFVGLFSASKMRSPEVGNGGMRRSYDAYYLVAKAGGGVAAQTFHSRLCAALRGGASLDEALRDGGEPGSRALRRVARAGERNRARLLELAVRSLGFEEQVDTIGDNASPDGFAYRSVLVDANVVTNCIREIDTEDGRSVWQYASGCMDSGVSQGAATMSNAHDGVVLFTDSEGGVAVSVKNDAFDSLPFGSVRLLSNRETVSIAAEARRRASRGGGEGHFASAHPDAQWIRTRFAWKSKQLPEAPHFDLEPPALWGSFASEEWLSAWARELGVSGLRATRLAPELVAIAAIEPAKFRAAARNVLGHGNSRVH